MRADRGHADFRSHHRLVALPPPCLCLSPDSVSSHFRSAPLISCRSRRDSFALRSQPRTPSSSSRHGSPRRGMTRNTNPFRFAAQTLWPHCSSRCPQQSRVLTAANVLINTLLFAAVIDFAPRPFFDTAQDVTFTRVGAVYPDSVKVVARYPDHSTLRVLYREVGHRALGRTAQTSISHLTRTGPPPPALKISGPVLHMNVCA